MIKLKVSKPTRNSQPSNESLMKTQGSRGIINLTPKAFDIINAKEGKGIVVSNPMEIELAELADSFGSQEVEDALLAYRDEKGEPLYSEGQEIILVVGISVVDPVFTGNDITVEEYKQLKGREKHSFSYNQEKDCYSTSELIYHLYGEERVASKLSRNGFNSSEVWKELKGDEKTYDLDGNEIETDILKQGDKYLRKSTKWEVTPISFEYENRTWFIAVFKSIDYNELVMRNRLTQTTPEDIENVRETNEEVQKIDEFED